MKVMKMRIIICSFIVLLTGCGPVTVVTYNANCLDIAKVDIPYLAGFGTSVDPNQFGYIWSDEKDTILIIKRDDLEGYLEYRFPFANIFLTDDNFALVDYYWFHHTFLPSVKKRLPKYSESFDCDNFSGSVVLFAQWLHNYTKCFNCDSVAVGELYYSVEGSLKEGHALNIILYKKGDKYLYEFYDINMTSRVVLTKKEINSVFFIRF